MSLSPAPRPSSSQPLFAALSYITVSCLMTLLNKKIISGFKFPGSNFLLVCECVVSTLFVGRGLLASRATATATAAKEKRRPPPPLQPFASQNLRFLFGCTVAKAVNMYFSFLSMRYTSIPVYNVLKRMNPIVALVIDSFLRSKSYPFLAKLGMVLLFCGAIVTGSGDLEFEPIGYVTALTAVVGQASYLVLSARALDNLPDLTYVDVLFYTGFYNVFLFFPLSIPELEPVKDFWNEKVMAKVASGEEPWAVYWFMGIFLLYITQGILLNYVTFWCTSVTSPVTTGVCGMVKGLVTSIFGVVIFGAKLTAVGWAGFALNSLGGLMYSLSKGSSKPGGKGKEGADNKKTK